MLNSYQSLSTKYYELTRPTCPKDAYDFYMEYCKRAKNPILEPMCGTGRFLLPLIEAGFEVHGFDMSQYMLNRLWHKASAVNLKPNVWLGNLENLNSDLVYDLVIIPSGSFGHIIELNKVKDSLKRIYSSLSTEGVFVFEVETIYSRTEHAGLWYDSIKKIDNNQAIVLSKYLFPIDQKNKTATLICKYEMLSGDQVIQTELEYFQVRLYEPEEIRLLLLEAGFKRIKFIKNYEGSNTISGKEKVFICECQK